MGDAKTYQILNGMNWKISLIFIFGFLVISCKNDVKTPKKDSKTIKNSSFLIEIEDFEKLKNQPNIKLIDFRKPKLYADGHLENAINIWRTDIEDDSQPYKGMMASKAKIETLFSKLGITNNDTLIIYDDNGLCDSSRLWWLLQNYGFNNVKLLNGGLSTLKTNNEVLSQDVPEFKSSNFKLPEVSPMRYHASKNDVMNALDKNHVILDTRTTDEFSGKRQKKNAFKGGRIPTSKLIDWAQAIDYHGSKKIKSRPDLESIYNRLGASKNDTIVVYCHSGVRSAHTTFVLTQLLDYKHVINYDGSWTEWSYFKELPVERDSTTTIFK